MTRFTLASTLLCAAIAFTGTVDAGEEIAYRVSEWKKAHFNNAADAAEHLEMVKKLGCEVQTVDHGEHTDFAFRSPKWESLSVADAKSAHEWESWLKTAGFETIHGHSRRQAVRTASHTTHDESAHNHSHASGHDESANVHASGHGEHEHGQDAGERVEYRLADWKTFHLQAGEKHDERLSLLKGFGCDIRSEQHTGHVDVSFRCPEWKVVQMPTHKEAQEWEAWLKKAGLEVRHSH